jgi:hypothetical protein
VAQALRTQNRPAAEVKVAEEMTLRVEAAGYGGVPARAVVPAEALSGIERADLTVETEMKIRVPGYGWRVVGSRISPGDKESIARGMGPARLTVPGYGHAPLRMSLLGRKR